MTHLIGTHIIAILLGVLVGAVISYRVGYRRAWSAGVRNGVDLATRSSDRDEAREFFDLPPIEKS